MIATPGVPLAPHLCSSLLSRDAAQHLCSNGPAQRMTWHPSAPRGDPTLGASLLGWNFWTCQPDPPGRGPFVRGGYVLSSQCNSSVVLANAPKLIRGFELPTCPTQFSPATLGMQRSLQPKATHTRTCQVSSFCSGSCGNLRVTDRAGIPALAEFGLSTLTTQRRVLGSSQNPSHTLLLSPPLLRSFPLPRLPSGSSGKIR